MLELFPSSVSSIEDDGDNETGLPLVLRPAAISEHIDDEESYEPKADKSGEIKDGVK